LANNRNKIERQQEAPLFLTFYKKWVINMTITTPNRRTHFHSGLDLRSQAFYEAVGQTEEPAVITGVHDTGCQVVIHLRGGYGLPPHRSLRYTPKDAQTLMRDLQADNLGGLFGKRVLLHTRHGRPLGIYYRH